MNVHRNGRTARERVDAHISLFRELWGQALRLFVDAPDTLFVVEWPTACDYWKYPEVLDALQSHNMQGRTSTVAHSVSLLQVGIVLVCP
jgi:hypothetical protein